MSTNTLEAPISLKQRNYLERLGAKNIPEDLAMVQASEWIVALQHENEKPVSERNPDLYAWPLGRHTPQAISRALAPAANETPQIIPASDMVTAYLVRPLVDIEAAKKIWDQFKAFRTHILSDEACYDVINDVKQINIVGVQRLAIVFGLSIEDRGIEEFPIMEGRLQVDTRYTARVRVSRGDRFADGIAMARLSEMDANRDIGWREHAAQAKAFSRALKRAVYAMLGGGTEDA